MTGKNDEIKVIKHDTIKKQTEELKKIEGKLHSNIIKRIHKDKDEDDEELVDERKELWKKKRGLEEGLVEKINGMREFVDLSNRFGYDHSVNEDDIYKAFLKIPKRWRKKAMELSEWDTVKALQDEDDYPKTENEKEHVKVLNTLEELRKKKANCIDDLQKPTKSEAMKMIEHLKEKRNTTWRDLKR